MSKGNFSSNGRDTFDPLKQYIGIRLQQGVPLLDRDWNELEDIRRHFERLLRRDYIGPGVPDAESFRISAPPFHAPGDFLIAPGRCLVDGYDVTNFAPLLYSEQPGCSPLPRATRDEVYTAYLQAEIVRVTSDEDPNLLNAQDINVETCVRDKLIWTVRLAVHPEQPPAGTYPLAIIRRPAGSEIITDDMIEDIRRPPLHLGTTVDSSSARTMQRVQWLEARLSDVQLDIENVKEQLSRLFWDVRLTVCVLGCVFRRQGRCNGNGDGWHGRPGERCGAVVFERLGGGSSRHGGHRSQRQGERHTRRSLRRDGTVAVGDRPAAGSGAEGRASDAE